MKSKRILYIVGAIFLFLCLAIITTSVIGYLYLQDQPPNPLADSGYYIRRTKVFYFPGFGLAEAFEIKGADPATFLVLDNGYALDDKRVYFDGVPIVDADPTSFEVFDSLFARDARHVYVGDRLFSNDPVNLEHVQGIIYRDSQHVYWSTSIISDDPANLVVLESSDAYTYLRDSTTVYVNGAAINGADPVSFEVIAYAYSQDATHVFYFRDEIPNADSTSFEALEPPYARDAFSVYWMGQAISGANPLTFRVLNANFECSADDAHAYYQDQIIPNFDPADLPADANIIGCSASGLNVTP